MIQVKFFGVLRLDLGVSSTEAEAKSINELLDVLSVKIEKLNNLNLKDYAIFVNGTNIIALKMFRTKLKNGDEVALMSPVSGG